MRVAVSAVILLAPRLALAEYAPADVEEVPVARVIANLERTLKAKPGDAGLLLNMARLHAMAFAAEIALLKRRQHLMLAIITRPITPIAIPLRPGVSLDEVVDPGAMVRFDVDGRMRPGTWSWIRPAAGWLVRLPREGSGGIRSGL